MMDLKQVEQWARDSKVWPMLETAAHPEEQPLVDKMNEQMLCRWARFATLVAAAEREACALDALQLVGANANGAIRHAENRIWDDAITDAVKRMRERGAMRDAAK